MPTTSSGHRIDRLSAALANKKYNSEIIVSDSKSALATLLRIISKKKLRCSCTAAMFFFEIIHSEGHC